MKMEELNTYRILIRKPLEKRTLGKVRKILSLTLVREVNIQGYS